VNELKKFQDNAARALFGRDRAKCKKRMICVFCGKKIMRFRDDLSRKEYNISGICQRCQDETFGTTEEEKS
jgi:hypothetical protein